MAVTTKTCSRCHQAKPLDDFKTDQRKPDGKASACKACVAVPRVGEIPIMTSKALVPVLNLQDPQTWIDRITERLRASVESIIESGRLLIQAKEMLSHGSWGAVLGGLPIGERQVQMLMAIAADQRLSNPQCIALLPASWGTIYDLTRLDDDELERGFREQIIRPGMERKDIDLIRPSRAAATPPQIAQPMSAAEVFANDDAGEPPETGLAARGTEARLSREDELDGGSPASPPMPSGGLAIAHPRDTSDEDLREFFPTPPWATRALVERVLVHLNRRGHCGLQKVWEPACGEGHMAEPLKEYFHAVFASDKYQYSYAAPHIDFLEFDQPISTDWIITNPPFRQSTAFVQKALKIAGTGVAMFVRLAWIEGVTRYEHLLRDNPPSLLSIFTERVPLHKGRWEPDGGTFTAYAWLVWIKGMPPQPPFWIPPGCRKDLFKDDDVKRFGKIAEAEEAA